MAEIRRRHPSPRRRDFLYVATGAVGTVGAAATLIPLFDQMEPDRATIAAGAPLDVDISKVQPGQQIQVFWRSKPIFIVNRTPAILKVLQEPQDDRAAERPGFDECTSSRPMRRTGTARPSRNIAVLVGICTHLGCIPMFFPDPNPSRPPPTGWAAISVPATARNTISPAACSKACRRPTTCRCRPIASSTTIRCASARTRPGVTYDLRRSIVQL